MRILLTAALVSLAVTRVGASLEVPADLRNPFEVADPTRIMEPTAVKTATTAKPDSEGPDPATTARLAAFAKINAKLRELPVKGIVASKRNDGDGTVLLGSYIIRREMSLPASDFDVANAIIRVASVDAREMTVLVTVDFETKKMTIPLSR